MVIRILDAVIMGFSVVAVGWSLGLIVVFVWVLVGDSNIRRKR